MSKETSPATKTLYLVQHGEARPKAEDPQRGLSQTGRSTVEEMAVWAAAKQLRVERIVHSGKLRASQTAELFAMKLQPTGGVEAREGLNPNDDVSAVADWLEDQSGPLMIVGHLPFLSRLVGKLVADDPDQALVLFRNAGLIVLVEEDRRWAVAAVIGPELI